MLACIPPVRSLGQAMSAFSKAMLVVVTLLTSISLAEAVSPRKPDMTKRQDEIGTKRAPVKHLDLQKNTALTDQRIPIKEWHAEFSPLGQRRSGIEVGEAREKTMIRPEVLDMQKIERKVFSKNRRMAHVRNFDRVRENQLVPKYRDAEVATVQQMSRPAPSNKQNEPLTMRDINRFSFQRNHADEGGPKVDKAGSAEKSGSAEKK